MSSPVQPPLRVETVDGTTSGRPITTIKVTNGDLTISGATATIDTSGGGGGSGTVTSVGTSQAFITITDPTTTPSISIGNASGAATGVLSAASFNTFDAKQDAITLTTTGTSGAATFAGGTLNIPQYTDSGGTVTSVGTSQAFITITDPTTTPSISIGNASGAATGVLSAASFNTFDAKQDAITLTTTGTSGAATFAGGTLNIPQYTDSGGTVTSVTGTAPIVSSGGTTPAISLANTAVTPGSYTTADITVDAQGRITAASTGSGGGGSPGGSDTQIQYNDGGSFGGSSVMTFDDTGSAEQVLFSGTSSKAIFKVEQLGAGNSIEVHDASTDTTIFLVDQFGRAAIKTNAVSSGYDLTVGGSTFIQGHLKLSTVGTTSAPAIKWDGDTTTGINKPSTGEIAIIASGTETFRFGANNDLEIAGNAGSAGQVFTSNGAGAAASWTTPSGGGTVTGTGSANQVSYWTAASVQAGSTGLTYDPSTGDLTVGGYVETGTKVTTPSGTNLELIPGGASSGSIVIADGANGQISITPNGTGTIKLDGVELDNSAIATGYVLKATSATAAGWAAESGGGGGGGSMLYGSPNGDWQTGYLEFQNIASNGWATSQASTTTDISSGRQFYRPFVSSMSGDLTAMSLNVSTSSAGSRIRVGIYNADSSDGNPTSLIGYGEFDSSSTGTKTITSFSTTITLERDKLYYYAVVATSGSPSVRSMNATYSNALYLANNYASTSWSLVDYTNTGALSDPASTSTMRGGNGSYPPINVGLKWV